MLAIPSPDVLMNLFASAAQVFGLILVCLSGGLFARRRMPGGGGPAQAASPWPLRLALLGLLMVSGGWLLYHLHVVDLRNQRLAANTLRSSQEGGKKVGDASLKTLSFSGQTAHPRGIATEAMQERLRRGEPINLVDVREPEEVEMGRIAGAWHRRYPDLQQDRTGLVLPDRPTVLVCESGNRSSELCDYFFEQGLVTSFMVGGYEKWKAEGRPMQGELDGGSDLRALPDFRNKAVLLDTPEAVALFQQENALFVDVRYPKEFEQEHLPGAVNVTLRKMRSDEVDAALAALPKDRPIVVPCYDKRSSFYALILGLRLDRLGLDFRGRYTVPHEFVLPKADSAWVAQWRETQAERTLFGEVRGALLGGLLWLRERLGGLALAILAAAVLLRLLLAPLGVKADRDGIVQRQGRAELKALRARLGQDPVRLRRAMMDWFRRHRLTPGRNVLGTLLQLLAFTALFAAIERACAGSGERFLWFPLGEPDAILVLPLLSAGLLLAIVRQQASASSMRSWVLGLGFVGLITALVLTCRAGTQLYLVVSFTALWLQGALVRRRLERGSRRQRSARTAAGILPLAAVADRPEVGGKASRLGAMLREGVPVPDGVVIVEGHQPTEAELDGLYRRLGGQPLAVRSSARGEDGSERSFAGEFRTLLHVARSGLRDAIAAVRRSYGGRGGGVVIQRMAPAEFAGVMFTEDPAHAGQVLVEMVEGLGESLVSGTATPTEHRFRRASGEAVGAEAPFDLGPLLELGRRLERAFGVPQDIEWARVGGRFVLLQSRDVTRRAGDGQGPVGVREAERARLLALAGVPGTSPAGEPVFASGDYAALLPEPSPYSLELMQAIWAPGGTVDLACRRIGHRYRAGEDARPFVQSVFGRCMVDLREERSRVAASARGGMQLGTRAESIDAAFTNDFLPEFTRQARLRAAMDLGRLEDGELHELLAATRRRFLESTYVEAEVINLAAESYLGAARQRLTAAGVDAAAVLGHGVVTVVQRAFDLLAGPLPAAMRSAAFVRAFGHRSRHDFELAAPRYQEDAATVAALATASGSTPARPAGQAPELPGGRLLRLSVARARRFQELKEAGKDAAMHDLALLRSVLLEIGRRTGLGELVFHLHDAEVARLAEPEYPAEARRLAAGRRERLALLRQVPVPDEVSAQDLERLGEQLPLPAMAPGGLRGARVAGEGEVVGRVVVLQEPHDLGRLQRSDVLVVRCTDPCWLPAFGRVAGLVTEIGGWLSHAAIQAREHGLPAIVGVRGATSQLRDGDLVRLHADGSIERLRDRRSHERQPMPVPVPVRLRLGEAEVGGRLLDLHEGGAAVAWDRQGPPGQQTMHVVRDGLALPAVVAWTNCTRFGVRFAAPLSAPQRQFLGLPPLREGE